MLRLARASASSRRALLHRQRGTYRSAFATAVRAVHATTPTAVPSAVPSSSLTPRGPERVPLAAKVGQKIGAWSVDAVEEHAELNVKVVSLVHASGARWVHLDTDDTHNHFSVSFRTPVWHSKGLPHVLEHVVLCGSSQFACKDPFQAMTRRSLSTEMNAATSSDHTTFYFSTQNAADYRNLTAVFLDLVFHPLLRGRDFNQEAHRFEPTNPSDASSPLDLKGVVYSEMRGYMSTAAEHIGRALFSQLFPATPYAHSHGGDPLVLPDLTHDELLAFHKQFYTPANALFVTYGDLDLRQHLADVEQRVLAARAGSEAAAADRAFVPPMLPRAGKPAPGPHVRRIRVPPDGGMAVPGADEEAAAAVEPAAAATVGGAEGADPRCSFLMSWACGEAADTYIALLLRVATDLLLAGSDSPVYRLLIDSGLAPSYGPGTGFDSSTADCVLTLGASGVDDQPATVAAVEQALLSAIRFACDPSTQPSMPLTAPTAAAKAQLSAEAALAAATAVHVPPDAVLHEHSQEHLTASSPAGRSSAGVEAESAVALPVAAAAGGGQADRKPLVDPFAPDKLRAMVHQLELSVRSRGPSFGATLASAVTEQWSHMRQSSWSVESLLAPLRVTQLIQRLKKDLGLASPTSQPTAEPLRRILRKYTLDNQHSIRLLAVPDASVLRDFEESHAARVRAAESTWTPEQREAAAAAARDAAAGKFRGDANTLPFLSIDEVSRVSPVIERRRHTVLNLNPTAKASSQSLASSRVPLYVPLQVNDERTNGIITLRLLFNLQLPQLGLFSATHPWLASQSSLWPALPPHLHHWLPLVCGFTSYGTATRTPQQWELDMRLNFARLGASVALASPTFSTAGSIPRLPPHNQQQHGDQQQRHHAPLYGLSVEASWLADKTSTCVPLLTELLTSSAASAGLVASRDRQLLAQGLRSASLDAVMHLADGADAYARQLAAASLNPLTQLRELQSGLSQTRFLRALHAAGGEGLDAAGAAMQQVTSAVLCRYSAPQAVAAPLHASLSGDAASGVDAVRMPLRAMLSCEGKDADKVAAAVEALLAALPEKPLQQEGSASAAAADTVPVSGVAAGGKKKGKKSAKTETLTVAAAAPTTTAATATAPAVASPDLSAITATLTAAAADVTGFKPTRNPTATAVWPAKSASVTGTGTGTAAATAPRLAVLDVPSAVSSLSLALHAPPWDSPRHAHTYLLCNLLAATALHEGIREAGGAYDVGARIGGCDEIIIHTGEDPTPRASLRRIGSAAAWAAGGGFSEQDLREAKLSVFSDIDAPVPPANKGLSTFLYGMTASARQQYRDTVLNATAADVAAAAKEYLLQPLEAGAFAAVVAGPAAQVLQEAEAPEGGKRSSKASKKGAAAAPAAPTVPALDVSKRKWKVLQPFPSA